jgi:phage tail-like protein
VSEPDHNGPAGADEHEGTTTISGFVTYAGEGFATVRAAPERGSHPNPTPVSNRRYLRDGLPALYREQAFAMQLVGGFEAVLDPIVAILDALAAHFDPTLSPLDILELTSTWLGVKPNEQQSTKQLRAAVRHAGELARLRGTRAGVELALRLNFPHLPLSVEDGGSVGWTPEVHTPTANPPSFVVYCDEPIPDQVAAAVARVIEAVKPAHVSYRLRIKEPNADSPVTR